MRKLKTKFPLGQLLIERNIITKEQLETALKKQKESGDLLGVTLLKLGYIDEESIFLPVLAGQFGVEYAALREVNIPKDVIERIPSKFAYHYKVIPVEFSNDTLTVATHRPQDIEMLDGLALVVRNKIKTTFASEKDILESIRKYYGLGAETIDQMMDNVDVSKTAKSSVENIEEIDSEASIGKFVNQLLLEAYKDRATDIHIEPYENELVIRNRVDGVLYDAQVPPNIKHFKDSINARIKILANLNIAEKRLPQDGRFKVKVGDSDLDFRVSFLPTQYGESVVIRILSSSKLYDFEELGLGKKDLSTLDELIRKPHGIIFITGPTGSGKTTTLYASLSRVNDGNKKIITIEDPIEYQLNGTTQIQIQPNIGLTFARGLRSMLRHDPDIMMVGEVRDLETAEIAIQVALTGHLVFSTLHTNDAASGITRLIDMGVEPYLVSSSVECFIAQRLIRLLCPKCKVPVQITPEIIKDFGLTNEDLNGVTIFEAKGCESCKSTGYRGREGIYEFLQMRDEIKELVLTRASATQIKNKAVLLGMHTLLQDGWEKVKKGMTTPSEIIRVTKEAVT